MEMPKPTPGHRALERLAGDWRGEETMYPSRWDPKGGTAAGRSVNRLALGGFAVVSDYEQTRGGAVTFRGHGVFTFDAKEDRYVLHWFDSMGSPAEVFRGRLEGDVLTLAHGGPGMHVRMTHDYGEPDRVRQSMEMSVDGTKWNRLFDGEYRRS